MGAKAGEVTACVCVQINKRRAAIVYYLSRVRRRAVHDVGVGGCSSSAAKVVVHDEDGAVEAEEEREHVEEPHRPDRVQEQHRVVQEWEHYTTHATRHTTHDTHVSDDDDKEEEEQRKEEEEEGVGGTVVAEEGDVEVVGEGEGVHGVGDDGGEEARAEDQGQQEELEHVEDDEQREEGVAVDVERVEPLHLLVHGVQRLHPQILVRHEPGRVVSCRM